MKIHSIILKYFHVYKQSYFIGIPHVYEHAYKELTTSC